MKAVLQRVLSAKVTVNDSVIGEVGKGYLVLLGIEKGDSMQDAEILAKKTANLRVFEDEKGKLNLSLLDRGGSVLVVSNFTLCADSTKGCRPSFLNAVQSENAKELYKAYCGYLKETGVDHIQTGRFGADMQISLVGDGPVTILIDTKELRKK